MPEFNMPPGVSTRDIPDPEVCADGAQHKWVLVRDWIGDHNVINGVQSFSYWNCKNCDATSDETPAGADDREFDE